MTKNKTNTTSESARQAEATESVMTLPPEMEHSLRAVVDYLWTAEQEHFESISDAARQGHIFMHLVLLRRSIMAGSTRAQEKI